MKEVISVLYIEDDSIDAESLERCLRSIDSLKFKVDHFTTIRDSLTYLGAFVPDIIFLDYNLPDSDGLHSIEKIQEVAPHIPIILITGAQDYKMGLELIKSGAQDYIVKDDINQNLIIRTVLYAIERKKQETELMEAKTQAVRSAELRDELIAIVSHDLRNPISTNKSMLDVLLTCDDDDFMDSGKDLILRAKNQADYALDLIRDLLDLASLEGGLKLNYSTFKIEDALNSCVETNLSQTESKKLKIKVDVKENVEMIADEARVLQVVNNIVSNAINYSPVEGVITIATSLEVRVDEFDEECRYLVISVKDEGDGIPENEISSIFNKFEQAKTHKQMGTGLGLAICKSIVDLHHGKIWAESEIGKGAHFFIELPLDVKIN